ncbi:aminophospholipid-translocating P4-type ATPase DNF2 [Nakaseomyces bracarensis]|uniref:aminophospholipid-translocating P4-type ATPase DNF2 n=1 Tax=Nakaseomyces bracarensis TaxID=273131 RepID=UPI0038726B7C
MSPTRSRSPFVEQENDNQQAISPFDDSNRFVTEHELDSLVNIGDTNTTLRDEMVEDEDQDTGNRARVQDENFGYKDYEELDFDDNVSFEPTPVVGRSEDGKFLPDDNKVLTFGPGDPVSKRRSARGTDGESGEPEIKRLRWGTQRRRKSMKKYDIGRNKTLKWAKKNIQSPFEELIGNETNANTDETGMANKADELRTIYHNLPLPSEMLDEDNNPIANYPRNKIRTTKYTPLTFLPKNIMFQFHNFANIYFLILLILGAFQIFGVTNPGFNAVPLIVIVIITAIKDGVEDSRRTVLDLEVNNTKTHILTGVDNPNVSSDDISLWRKFKKANTRLLVSSVTFINERVTQHGRQKRAQRERQKMNHKKRQSRTFRASMASYQSRYSMDMRPSMDMRGSMEMRPSMDVGEFNDPLENSLINKTIPHNMDWRFAKDFWKNVKVGDIVRVHNNEEIPADIVLLSTSDSDGACYVETKNLDGETNLKVRQSMKCISDVRSSADIARTKFWIESEGPHANLYSYQANFKWHDLATDEVLNEPIGINNLLLRGCTLRNTKWAMGIVAFTGNDTKIMLNTGVTPTKKSRISRELNISVLFNFALLFVLCFVAGLANGIFHDKHPRSRDFFEFGTGTGGPATSGFVSFWVAVILYQSLVPISLYISIEIIKTAQAIFIYMDVMMYNAKLDYPCTPKSWNISDDLGQIEYIFSDKTGTLTQNVMEFKKCTINGVSYGRAYTEALAGLRKRQGVDVEKEGKFEKEGIKNDREVMIRELQNLSKNSQFYPDELTFVSKEFVHDLGGNSGEIQQKSCQHFMLALAVCHSVLIETSKEDPNKLELKAQSPDEAALVTTARDMGFSFVKKTKDSMVIEVQGIEKEFQVLNILEFNSSRKRMSCIIKIPAETPNSKPRALLICKGADSVIYSRLNKTGLNDETLLEKTALHLEQYATEGLRTLCIAQRELTWEEYENWNKNYDIAAAAITNREDELEKVSDQIERNLILLGGTAIEDRLQDGVPDSIALLGEAGIKLWVLTGDKVETAINIGFSCNLLNNDMELLVVKNSGADVEELGNTPKEIVDTLISQYLHDKFGMAGSEEELQLAKKQHDIPKGEFAVIIDGDALKYALSSDDLKRKFLLLCKNCKSVLCCRVSPSQKAAVVKLVKNTLDVMTLAIGDGSNDVAMIQSANIGVGIAGEEGRQAVMSSDYAIGQFRYLTRLLLVHGKWCYKRLAEMIPLFFYKNVIFTLALFWFGIYNNYDGSYLFEYTYLTFYNLAFTSIPVILLGIFDQDVSDTLSVIFPQLYRVGILRKEWNQTKFLYYMFDGLYQSIICFFFPYLLYRRNMVVTGNGLGLDHRYYVGVPVTAIAAITCNLYILMEQKRWDIFCSFFIGISIMIFFTWTGIWSSASRSNEFYKGAARVFGTPSFWAVMFVGIMFCLLPRFSFDVFKRFFYPNDVDIIREMWSRGDFDHLPEKYDPTDPDTPKISLAQVYDKNQAIQKTSTPYSSSSSSEDVVSEEIELATTKDKFVANPQPEYESGVGDEILKYYLGKDSNRNTLNIDNSKRMSMYSRASNQPKTSLDITREEMIMSNQLDNRYSVERARASLELPGINHAESLMSK